MTALDDMDSDEAANMLEACCILLEAGPAQATLSGPALAELRAIRDRAAARLGQHVEVVTGPSELEARWTRGDSDPPAEDDHLRPPGTD